MLPTRFRPMIWPKPRWRQTAKFTYIIVTLARSA